MLYCVSNNLFHFYTRKRFKDDGYMMSLARKSQANFPKSNKESDGATKLKSGPASTQWMIQS